MWNLDQKLDFLTKGLSAKLNFSYNNYSTGMVEELLTPVIIIFLILMEIITYWDRYLGGSQK